MSEIKSVIVNGIEYMPKPAPEGKCETCGISLKPGARFCGDHWRDYPGKGEGWEIVKWNHYVTGGISTVGSLHANDPVSIYSVRRESDGEVFSIGDEVCWGSDKKFRTKICSFRVSKYECGIELGWSGNHGELFVDFIAAHQLHKPATKQPLFTTSDGKAVYEGDAGFVMNKESFAYSPCTFYSKKPFPGDRLQFIYFSSESAAKEYILLNKPVLSVNDIFGLWSVGGESRTKLINLAKSKIDKP